MSDDLSYRRPCPRTLDRPILVFGLEPEDLVVLGLMGGLLLFIVDPLVAVGVSIAAWLTLLRLKAGRPPGYLFYLAYKSGLLLALPRSLRPPNLLPSPSTREGLKLRLSAFGGSHEDRLVRDWWGA